MASESRFMKKFKSTRRQEYSQHKAVSNTNKAFKIQTRFNIPRN